MRYFQNLTGSLPVRYCKILPGALLTILVLRYLCVTIYNTSIFLRHTSIILYIQVSFCIYKYNFESDALMLKSCTGMDFLKAQTNEYYYCMS